MTNKINPEGLYQGIEASGNKEVFGWHSKEGIFRRLIEESRPRVIIEVGTWLGASAIHMGKIAKEIDPQTKIYCVDTWLGAEEFWTKWADTPERDLLCANGYPTVYFKFLANVVEHGLQGTIIPVPNTSHIGSMILRHMGVKADLIYIDGSHEYEDVKSDIRDYTPLLEEGGVMFGDDVDWDDVRRAVLESMGDRAQMEGGNFWVFRNDRADNGKSFLPNEKGTEPNER